MRHGGQVLVDGLKALGVPRVFSVPGESFLAVLDGLVDSGIDNVVCRHEGGAAMMAEATGKLTGRPGIAFVTRGPGATNAAAGVHVAHQDPTPMILFVGQVARGHRDREAFQEVDFRAMFTPLAKWAAEVDDPARLPEYLARAWNVALSGRPGPVVLSLPEDVLSARVEVADAGPPPAVMAPTFLGIAEDALGWLAQGARPMIVVGGPHWSAEAAADLGRVAETQGVPVALSFRRQDYLDNRHPCYAGDLNVGVNPRLAERLRRSDRVLAVGTRLGDIPTGGYTLPRQEDGGPRILQVHAEPDEPGKVVRPEFSVTATAPAFVRALARQAPVGRDWSAWTREARADYEAWLEPKESPGPVKLEAVVRWLSESLPEDAILTNGAGNYAAWLHRYFVFKRFRTAVAPTSGSMGYGFPAAIASCLAHPDRTIVCFAGDGCFQMTLNEMSTAVQHGVAPVVIVVNNGRYGTIRMHQERHYPGRVSGTDLANPDFAALARAYGGHGETVRETAEFPEAFARARDAGVPAVIELAVGGEALTTGMSLAEVRAKA